MSFANNFLYNEKASFVAFFDLPPFSDGLIVVFYPISFSEKPDFKILKKLSVRFNIFIRFSMIFLFRLSVSFHSLLNLAFLDRLQRLAAGGLKWTRTTDLVLIRHAL